MISPANSTTADPATQNEGIGILPTCVLLAALAQFLYLLHWPMYLFGRWIPFVPAVAVAFVRMGIYAGLAFGLVRREPVAWAGSLAELARSVLLFLVCVWQHEGTLTSELFPAWWAQGMFAGVLPVLLALLTALDWGWRPGTDLIRQVSIAARLIVGITVLTVVSLRRKAPLFRIDPPREGGIMVRKGLPVVLVLTAIEVTAWYFAGPH